jgi:YfiH family protein
LEQRLPGPPQWLNQVHGRDVVVIEPGLVEPGETPGAWPTADAAVTRHRGLVLAVLTADCLPVVIADREGRAVGVAHAGWRGLAAGVVEATVAAVLELSDGVPADCEVWLGPAIGPTHFEVGLDVWRAFCEPDPGAAGAFRRSAKPDKWLADLPALARRQLQGAGVTRIQGGQWCTVADPHRFFSYRRDRVTGRMATLVWLT